jgi:hypothetical protein
MRRITAGVLLALGLLLAVPARSADAQSPAPVTETADDTESGRPWGRLAIFIPVSVAIGAAAMYGRRLARDRGWTQS